MTLLFVAGALLVWPSGAASRRLAELVGVPRRAWRVPKPTTVLVALGSGLSGGLLFGVGGAIAGVLAGVVAWKRWRARQRLRQSVASVAELAETLRSFVAELRAGAQPVVAAESVAEDAPPAGAEAMQTIASAARAGGDAEQATREPLVAEVVHAWVLAQRHGLPLADVLAAVAKDLDQRVRFARQTHAKMAGPRASAAVLAGLPVLGIVLGEAVGANPLRVLAFTGIGQIVLVLGVALVCAGVIWCARLTQRVVQP
ncbi:tight adherence protein B [Kibdelosporangium banguiense]|uniref:Tight adherence protein B n=1 Tax=Kibdelosporangium banguiense TaxID=1365924 RepID=A0ABS4TAH4_9PSEU|nr:type II secretion system F family protein [Kibdelosporangium banguiense]MBP2321430.1 tight adherence protein B [Kibdelosporangium banguiense]